MTASKATGTIRVKRRPGPYSREGVLGTLDKRSKEALFLSRYRDNLVAHLGGNVSAGEDALIARASWLAFRCDQLDGRLLAGKLSETDARQYLAWSNALTRTLKAIGIKAVPERPGAALDEQIARIRAEGVSA